MSCQPRADGARCERCVRVEFAAWGLPVQREVAHAWNEGAREGWDGGGTTGRELSQAQPAAL